MFAGSTPALATLLGSDDMRHLNMVPKGWSCSLEECPPGFFTCVNDIVNPDLCFKTQYTRDDGRPGAYGPAGEVFSCPNPREVLVQPVVPEWVDIEE